MLTRRTFLQSAAVVFELSATRLGSPTSKPSKPEVSHDPTQMDIFINGEAGYKNFRIPALIVTLKGTVIAFCEGRPSESDSGNIDVVTKRSRDNGKTWSALRVVADFGADAIGNPTPVVDRTSGTLWMLLTSNPGAMDEEKIMEAKSPGTRTVWVTSSDDDGLSWSTPRNITSTTKLSTWTWYATGPGNGIQLRSGRMVIPCDHTESGTKERYSHVIFSDDHGKTWQLGGSSGPDTNESTVVQLTSGTLLLNMRNYGVRRRRSIAYSQDEGMTWTPPAPDPVLIEPVCQASLISVPGSGILLFANPASESRRERLTVRLSRDDGRTWASSRVLYAGPAAYSSLACLTDGTIGCLYERGHRNENEFIAFARFPLKWVATR